tara:strand:+ start:1445 stop:1636 length:192 start_codon:yes stop_codon:yes gene_type:complete
MFCINVGKVERLIRVLLGFLIFYMGVLAQVEPKLWGFIGLIPVITGILGWCPLYLPFKINTNK